MDDHLWTIEADYILELLPTVSPPLGRQQRTMTFNSKIYSSIPDYGEHLLNRGINTNGYPKHTKQRTPNGLIHMDNTS